MDDYMSIGKAARTLEMRAAIFMCSYKTAWNEHIGWQIKEEYSFKEVMNYMQHLKRIKKNR